MIYKKKISEFYLSNETLLRSKFRNIKLGSVLNLELPLIFGQKISGHICQGHVDTVGHVKLIKKIDKSYLFQFSVDTKTSKQLIEKASICINGISLTISKIKKNFFEIWVIPHTFNETNLSNLKKIKNFGLVTPYLDDIQQKIIHNFKKEGFDCIAEKHLGDKGNFSFSDYKPETIKNMVER